MVQNTFLDELATIEVLLWLKKGFQRWVCSWKKGLRRAKVDLYEVFIQQIDTMNMVMFYPSIDNFILLVACIHEQCFVHFVYFIVDVYLRFYFLHIIECHLFAIVSSFPTSILFFPCTLFLNFQHPPFPYFFPFPSQNDIWQLFHVIVSFHLQKSYFFPLRNQRFVFH